MRAAEGPIATAAPAIGAVLGTAWGLWAAGSLGKMGVGAAAIADPTLSAAEREAGSETLDDGTKSLSLAMFTAGLANVANTLSPFNSIVSKYGGVNNPVYKYDASTGQYRDVSTGRFVSPRDLPWPNNNGFAKDPVYTTLPQNTLIDRYGKLTGQYAGEPSTPISARGMAPGSEDMQYTVLRVVKPITVPAGPAAAVPEFGADGGGMQYAVLFDGWYPKMD